VERVRALVNVEQFWTAGFAAIEQLIDGAEVARLRTAYDEILDGRVASHTDRNLGGITRQVMVPSMVHPVFDDNAALRAGRSVMAALFGCAHANRTYDMLIDKPAGHPHETPWHQDAGYFAMPVAPAGTTLPLTSIQFWVALDDADEDNGCMQFVGGAHRGGTVEHVVVSGHPDDEGRLIGYADPTVIDPASVTACPLRAGGATIHTAMTPHYTGPNRTADRPRRAYIFNLVAADEADDRIESTVRAGYVREIASSVERGIAERPRLT
jgi:ectoine hydroxylase-related dioxygenase (phytanoyl-CoA dioxygenase family)